MEYKASLDTLSRVISLMTIFFIAALAVWRVYTAFSNQDDKVFMMILAGTTVLLLLILFVAYGFAPQGYIVASEGLTVKRLFGDRQIHFKEILEARLVDRDETKNSIRTFGSGGFFGYYGKFYNGKLGSMTWYLTQRENRILIVTKKGEKILISPDDTGLLQTLQARVKNAQS